MRLLLLAFPAMLALAASPAAAAEDDGNVWLGQFATINATDKVYVRLEAQERFTNDAERLGNCCYARWWVIASPRTSISAQVMPTS